MRTALSVVWCSVIAMGLSACGSARETAQAQQGNTYCFSCHSETSPLGIKIQSALAGYEYSAHKNGPPSKVYTVTPAVGACPPFVAATPADCTSNGGTIANTICTMPAGATQQACVAAGGTYAPPVDDPMRTGSGTSACPVFAQYTASGTSLCARVFGASQYSGTTCTPAIIAGASFVTQYMCQSAGGTWVGPTFAYAGTQFRYSNALRENGEGCQICHTQEGFRKRVAGAYDAPDGSYSVRFGWSTLAAAEDAPLTIDLIDSPSALGCFGCHTPHGIGTVDGQHLDQTIPPGTAITTQSGAVYGNATTGQNKARGHVCAECHQMRLNSGKSTSAIEVLLARATGTDTFNPSANPHHAPQTDLLLGKGGAEYSGTVQNGAVSVTFAGTYGNSAHATLADADCVTCHMQFDEIDSTAAYSGPTLGGHAFTNKSSIPGTSEKVLALGCGYAKDAQGCHTVSGVATSSGSTMTASSVGSSTKTVTVASVKSSTGYLQKGDAYYLKSTVADATADSNYHLIINELLTKLANPTLNCAGLLQTAARASVARGTITWKTMPDGATIDPHCSVSKVTNVNQAAAPLDDNAYAPLRLSKALWNFNLIWEDKSFGVHNVKYLSELLYDSCVDLAVLTGQSCGTNAGRCSYCEGKYVTSRP